MPEIEEDQSFDFSQIPQFLRRRRWWILLTACASTLATIAAVQLIPNRYTSDATVLVIQQQVPERYVVSTTTTDVSQALQGMTQEVLSRARLLSIIDAVGLYEKERKHLAPEQMLERMRRDIDIQPLETGPEKRNVNSFKISFVADNAQRAQAVTAKLTQLFIQENVNMREHQATITTNFLQEHLRSVKKQLEDQEALVQRFKMQHLGDLPEQEQGNVQILSSLSAQLQSTVGALSRAQEQKVYLESLLRGYQDVPERDAGPAAGSSVGSPGAEVTASPTAALEKDVARLKAERSTLLSRYTADHPDVVRLDAEITKAEASLAQTQSLPQAPKPQKTGSPAVLPHRREDAPIAQVKSQLEANRVETENLTKDAGALREKIAQYQERLNATPVREQQLAGMLRDYELLKLNYADLLKKQQESGLAVSLEEHQEGQQFRLVDPPSLPTIPSSPKRLKMSLGGAAGGIALGFALAFFVETTKRSFYSEKQLRNSVHIPLVVALPVFLTRSEERRQAWRRSFEWFAGSVLVLMVLAAEFYVYRRG
jgi:polysaccharide chain length determinant protein (PEP-CTERM system associated)